MKNVRYYFITAICLLSSTSLFAQLEIKTDVKTDAITGTQTIQANVKGGSGEYTYAWGIKGAGLVPENSSSSTLMVLAPVEKSQYSIFVRDVKTGSIAYSTADVDAVAEKIADIVQMPGVGNGSRYRGNFTLPAKFTNPK
jgi:endoglucanase Acf2